MERAGLRSGTRTPRRAALRPGLHVVRRDARHLQVGIDPPLRVVLPDVADVRALVGSLVDGALVDDPPPSSPAASALRSLADAGALVDPDLGVPCDVDPRAGLVARTQFGDDAARRLTARRDATVGVRGPTAARHRIRELLAGAGLCLAADREHATVWLVVAAGELLRESVDSLVREGAPHLVLSGTSARLRLGPFVEPGRTACVRCVDAHKSVHDPRRALVVEQVARATARGDLAPPDPHLEAMALGWVARDLATYVEGDEPTTWSATITIEPRGLPRREAWARHPHCGCAWDEGLSGFGP